MSWSVAVQNVAVRSSATHQTIRHTLRAFQARGREGDVGVPAAVCPVRVRRLLDSRLKRDDERTRTAVLPRSDAKEVDRVVVVGG